MATTKKDDTKNPPKGGKDKDPDDVTPKGKGKTDEPDPKAKDKGKGKDAKGAKGDDGTIDESSVPNSPDNAKTATANAIEASQEAKANPSKKANALASKAHAAAAKINATAFQVTGEASFAANSLMHQSHAAQHSALSAQFSDTSDDDADVDGDTQGAAMARGDALSFNMDLFSDEATRSNEAVLDIDEMRARFNDNHGANGERGGGNPNHDSSGKFSTGDDANDNVAATINKNAGNTAKASVHETAASIHKGVLSEKVTGSKHGIALTDLPSLRAKLRQRAVALIATR